MSEHSYRAVVVGSDLSARSPKMTVVEQGLPAMRIEKEKRLGGNSVKTWSGQNGAEKEEQGIPVSLDLFAKDNSTKVNSVVVFGSGLSTGSAAMTVVEQDLPVMMIENEKRPASNSVKAWADLFTKDTAFSGYKTDNIEHSDSESSTKTNREGPKHDH